jgi:hypothetical protein
MATGADDTPLLECLVAYIPPLSMAGYPLGIASDVLIRKYAVGHQVGEQLHNCGVGKRAVSMHLAGSIALPIPLWTSGGMLPLVLYGTAPQSGRPILHRFYVLFISS